MSATATVTLIHASKNWLLARTELLELDVHHPDYRARLDALSRAEDALAKAIRKMEEVSR